MQYKFQPILLYGTRVETPLFSQHEDFFGEGLKSLFQTKHFLESRSYVSAVLIQSPQNFQDFFQCRIVRLVIKRLNWYSVFGLKEKGYRVVVHQNDPGEVLTAH